ncbi:MAG: hypothetical protein V4449_04180 [Patescibacteria group bacterium]
MENSTPAPVHSNKKLLLIGVLVVVLVALGAWYAYTIPVRLIGLHVFEGDYRTGKVLSFGILGLAEKKLSVNGVVADYASAKGTAVAVVRNPDTNTEDILLMSDNGRTLTTDGEGKVALAVSPDGTMVAYSALTNAPADTFFTPQFSAWTIKVINIKTGEMTLMGSGFGPEFFTSNGKLMLMFTDATGITIADMATKTSQTTFFLNPGVIDYSAHISDDGKFIAIPNGLTKHYDLFAVTHLEAPLGIDPLGSVEPVLVHGDFKGSNFYGVEYIRDVNSRLWRFTTAKPPVGEVVFDLRAQSLYRVLP